MWNSQSYMVCDFQHFPTIIYYDSFAKLPDFGLVNEKGRLGLSRFKSFGCFCGYDSGGFRHLCSSFILLRGRI